jgi:hypothetical protein
MILYHFQNRQHTKFFRESRESFFANIFTQADINNAKGINNDGALSESERKKKELAEKKRNKEIEQRNKISKILKKGRNIEKLNSDEISELQKFKKKDIEAVLKKNFDKNEKHKLLNILEENERNEVQSLFSFLRDHPNDKLDNNFQNLLTRIPPKIFLKKYVKGDSINKKKYFKGLQKLNRKRPETFAFVKSLEEKDSLEFIATMGNREQRIFLNLINQTNRANRKGFMGFLEDIREKLIGNAVSNALDARSEVAKEEMTREKKEEKMLASVRKSLGKNVAERVKNEAFNEKVNEKQRIKVFFEVLREETSNKLKQIKNAEKAKVQESILESKMLYKELFELSSYSSEKKAEIEQQINRIYAQIEEYFVAIEEGNVDTAMFLHEKLDKISENEVGQIKKIEKVYTQVQNNCLGYYEIFSGYTQEIEDLSNLDWGTMTSKQIMQQSAVQEFQKRTGVSAKKLFLAITKGDKIEPTDFPEFKKRMNEMGFSSYYEINQAIYHAENLEKHLAPKILQYWLNLGSDKKQKISKRVLIFYKKTPQEKKIAVLDFLAQSEEKFANDLEQGGKLSFASEKKYLGELYKEKMNPDFLLDQIEGARTELLETVSVLNNQEGTATIKLKNSLTNALKNFPQVSRQDIEKNNKKFSDLLVKIVKQTGGVQTITEGLEYFGEGYAREMLKNQKEELIEQKKSGNLENYLKTRQERFHSGEMKKIAEFVAPSLEETNLSNFQKNFLGISKNISLGEGSFTKENIASLLSVQNRHGDNFIIPVSQTDLLPEEFRKISNAGIAFDSQHEFIIVDDDIYQQMQEGDMSNFHISALSHEIAHLWAAHSNFTKGAEKLLQEANILENIKEDIDKIYKNKEGEAENIEEVFALLVSAHQFGLSTFTAENLGISNDIYQLLQSIIRKVGKSKIKKLINESEEEFQESLKKIQKKNHFRQKYSIDKGRTSGFTTQEAGVETPDSDSQEQDSSGPISPLKRREQQVIFQSKKKNIENILNDIVNYKKRIPEYANVIDEFVENANNRLQESEQELASPNLTKDESENILKYIDEPLYDTAIQFSAALAKSDNQADGFFESAWNNTRFLSMNDIGRIWTTTWEYIKRRFDTQAKRRVGEAGNSMFSGIIDGLANEFDKEKESAEKEEVGNIQGSLENKNPNQLYEFLKNCSTKDDLKATMQELAKRGLIDWTHPEIGDVLLRLGSKTPFYPSDYNNSLLLGEKYRKAFMRVYDDDEMYQSLFSENDGNIQSTIDKYMKEAATMANPKGSILQMIENHRNGEYIDPNQFEAYAKYLPADGKGGPSDGFLYIIYGVAAGIIPVQSFKRLDLLQNNYPLSNFLTENEWTREDVQGWYKEIAWNGEKMLRPEKIDPKSMDHWIFKNVMTNEGVIGRSLSNLAQVKNFDHDHGRLLAAIGDSGNGISFLSKGSTGDGKVKTTIYANALAGMMEYASSIALQEKDMEHDDLIKTITRQAGYFTAFDGVTSRRMNTLKKNKFTFSPNDLLSKPREGGAYNGNMTVRDYQLAQRKIYESVESKNFREFLQQVVYSEDMVGNYKKLGDIVDGWMKRCPDINEALEDAGINKTSLDSDEVPGHTFYEIGVPALFNYFLNPKEGMEYITKNDAEKNVQAILEKTREISAGKVNKDWANTGDYNNPETQKDPNDKFPRPPNKANIPHEAFNMSMEDILKQQKGG